MENKRTKWSYFFKMIRNVIIGNCVFFFSISFTGSIINFFEAIIGCPGMFSEHLMPPRGVEP